MQSRLKSEKMPCMEVKYHSRQLKLFQKKKQKTFFLVTTEPKKPLAPQVKIKKIYNTCVSRIGPIHLNNPV